MVHDGSTVAVTVVYNLVGGLEHEFYDFPYIGNFIIPTDELQNFSEGRYTTNQMNIVGKWDLFSMSGKLKIMDVEN